MSFPAEIPKINENLNASVLNWSITSNGSIPFPNDLEECCDKWIRQNLKIITNV